MNKLFLFLYLFAFSITAIAGKETLHKTDSIPANVKDVESINAIVLALYDVISGAKDQKRNWDRMRTLFVPTGKLIPSGKRPDGSVAHRFLSVEDYINSSGPVLEKNGFFEKEIGRKTEQYGNIAHVFSTYESFHDLSEKQPFMRGINSIQLLYDGKRWWILNVFWQAESKEFPIPEKYLD